MAHIICQARRVFAVMVNVLNMLFVKRETVRPAAATFFELGLCERVLLFYLMFPKIPIDDGP